MFGGVPGCAAMPAGLAASAATASSSTQQFLVNGFQLTEKIFLNMAP
jgi:hypothetical protein